MFSRLILFRSLIAAVSLVLLLVVGNRFLGLPPGYSILAAVPLSEDEQAIANGPTETPTPMATNAAAVMETPMPRPTATPTKTPTPAPTATPIEIPTPLPARIKVPILMYHYIRINPDPKDTIGFNLSVTPRNFEAQVAYLTEAGYRAVSMEQLVGYFEQGAPLPPKPIVLSFDDGYQDFYTEAYPVLKKYGQTGTSFVITGLVGKWGYLTADEIAEMAADGIEFGGHTASHLDMKRMSSAQAQYEVNASKQALDSWTGKTSIAFCYPAGSYNRAAIDFVKAAGYHAAVTTDFGMWHRASDLFTLKRVRMSGSTTVASLASQLAR